MNDGEYERERRRQQRLERLGSNDPRCIVCGQSDPRCLELHHLAGKAFGDDQVILCRNDHRKLSDMQREHPPIFPGKPTKNECEGRKLLGIADLVELLNVAPLLVALIRQTGGGLIERAELLSLRDKGDEL
jgi:hypothetical protein